MNATPNRWGLLALALTIIAFGGAMLLVLIPAPKTPADIASSTATSTAAAATTSQTIVGIPDLIVVNTPASGATVASPLTISGSARGSWYFEASFPIVLIDWDGKIIAQGTAQAQGDWMTTDFVPFKATLTFVAPATGGDPAHNRGTLILKKDNPSGDPSRDQAVEVPVEFKTTTKNAF